MFNELFQRLNLELHEQRAVRAPDYPRPDDLDFASNDYLGLASCLKWRSEVWEQMRAHFQDRHFLGSTGSRFISGYHETMQSLEQDLAAALGEEKAIYFPTGYMANLGLTSGLGQIDGAKVFYDQQVHASIKDGLKLGRVEAQPFRHNDLQHLEARLQKTSQTETVFVIVESLYSMDGDYAPLLEIAELCQEFQAALIVDEAHTFGWAGNRMLGLVEELGIKERVFARLITFGKALGSMGAAIVLDKEAGLWFCQKAHSAVYSTAPGPLHVLPNLIALHALLGEKFFEQRDILSHNIRYFDAKAKTLGQELIGDSYSPIRGILVPGNEELLATQEKLRQQGIFMKGIRSPTVRRGEERLRISLHARQKPEDIDRLLEALG